MNSTEVQTFSTNSSKTAMEYSCTHVNVQYIGLDPSSRCKVWLQAMILNEWKRVHTNKLNTINRWGDQPEPLSYTYTASN